MKVVIDGWAWLDANELTTVQKEALKADLTLVPRKTGNYPGDDEPKVLKLYEERPGRFGVPRQYFMERKKPHHEVVINTSEGDPSVWRDNPVPFAGSLRPAQQEALDAIVNAKNRGSLGGILRAPTGFGKTVLACAVAAALKTPVLVVVHKEFLMSQWKERIEQFLPGAKIGHVQQDVCDYRGCHIVMAMVHTLVARDYNKDFYDYFGTICFDETHRVAAASWSVTPPKFTSSFRLGVSATPRRKDGCEDVFFYHLGPILYDAKEVRLKPKLKRVWTSFIVAKTDKFNPSLAPRSLIIRFLCANPMRNRQIVEQLIQARQAGRKILVLSERLKHLDVLEHMFLAAWKPEMGATPTTGKYVGGMTEEARDESATKDVIFATVGFASEGLDIAPLDTIFLTTPMVDIVQAVGRILRPYEGKKEPVVVDFRDDKVPMLAKFGEARDRFLSKIIDK